MLADLILVVSLGLVSFVCPLEVACLPPDFEVLQKYYGFRPNSTDVDTVSIHAPAPTELRKRKKIISLSVLADRQRGIELF